MKYIAEIGSNYYVNGERSLTRALDLIEEAARSGATHVKFQLFTGETLHSDPAVQAVLDERALPVEWLPELKAEADKNDVEFLITPFYPEAVDEILPYVNEIKLASWDITYIPLLIKVAQTGLPVYLSTAGATIPEIEAAITYLRPGDEFPEDVTLLYCHAGYPVPVSEANLRGMLEIAGAMPLDLDADYFMPYGLSSHVPDPEVNAAAVVLGATVIEAHFDLMDGAGPEAPHSLNPAQFARMVKLADKLAVARGSYLFEGEATRQESLDNYRRSPDDWLRPAKR